MPTIKIPTPLRSYTAGAAELEIASGKVAEAMQELVQQHPSLAPHIQNEEGKLRPYVNLFVNEENIRDLEGLDTPIDEGDELMILPSIAGGAGSEQLDRVDHSALRTNQAVIIGLSLAAFVLDAAWLALLVGLQMLYGTLRGFPGFAFLYQSWLKPRGWVEPDVMADNQEPHRFAQGFGAVVLLAAGFLFWVGGATAGWVLVWLVIALAALNLFGGFCVGCAVYYWLGRLGLPGFVKSPPAGAVPGMRPGKQEVQ